jgi:hypothetical protein
MVMTLHRTADADGAGWRTRERRRESDLAFLAELRRATLPELEVMRTNYRHKSAPEWRRAAIEVAIARSVGR